MYIDGKFKNYTQFIAIKKKNLSDDSANHPMVSLGYR